MNKVFIGLIIIVAIVAIFFIYKNQAAPPTTSQTSNQTEVTVPASTTQSYTLEDIAKHGSRTSCWMAIEGKVYDVSPYIAGAEHPGKDEILKGCGIDATELFNNRPENEGPHSVKAREMLKSYYIGELKQ